MVSTLCYNSAETTTRVLLNEKMHAGDSGLSRYNLIVNRKQSMEYSRHLCQDIARSGTTVPRNGRTRAAFSDSEAFRSLHSHDYHGKYDGINRRNSTQGRKESFQKLPLRGNVISLDKKFHRKFGGKNEPKDTNNRVSLASVSQSGNWRTNQSVNLEGEHDDQSVCDSFSSLTCSDFTNADVEKPSKMCYVEPPNKMAKFEAIETWLQHLPAPSLRTDFEKTRKN